jgi:alpha-glucosidase
MIAERLAWWAEQPHHDGSATYRDGEPQIGGSLEVHLLEPDPGVIAECSVRYTRDGDAFVESTHQGRTGPEGRWWTAVVPITSVTTSYRFILKLVGTDPATWYLNAYGLHRVEPGDTLDFRPESVQPGPGLSPSEIVYQILIDRFARAGAPNDDGLDTWDAPVETEWPASAEQFFGGDLDGIRTRIPYLESLGVTTVLLTPFFPSPESHRYSASDFSTVDPRLGGDNALIDLVSTLHDRGLRCLGDLTLNHCGSNHSWFVRAQEDSMSPERRLFAFYDWPNGVHTYHGVASLPRFDYRHEVAFERMIDGPNAVSRHWLRPPFNLDGWRVDVAGSVGRIDSVDENARVRQRLSATVCEERSDAGLLAEIPRDPSLDLGSDGWPGALLDAGFASPVRRWVSRDAQYDGHDLVIALKSFAAQQSWQAQARSASFIGSHDFTRIASVTRDGGRLRAAFALLFTLVPVPVIFAGDEVGLTGASVESARRTMPWSKDSLAPEGDHELLSTVRTLIALRHRQEALTRGGLRWLGAWRDAVLFERATQRERVVCLIARCAAEFSLSPLQTSFWEPLIEGPPIIERSGEAVALVSEEANIGIWLA